MPDAIYHSDESAEAGPAAKVTKLESDSRPATVKPSKGGRPVAASADVQAIGPATTVQEGATGSAEAQANPSIPTETPEAKRPPSRSARRKAKKRMLRRTGVLPYTGELLSF